MKTDKYNDWESKFFEGETLTPEALEILQSESENPYFSVVKSEQKETLDISFDDFMSRVVEDKPVAETVQLTAVKKAFPFKIKEYWAAASLLMCMGLLGGYFFVNNNDGQVKNKPIAVKKPTLKSDSKINVLPTNVTQKQDLVIAEKTDEKQSVALDFSDKVKIADDVVFDEDVLANNETAVQEDNGYQANYVIINGKPVYNEQEAIALTEDAINYLASNVNKTVSHVESVKSLNLDF